MTKKEDPYLDLFQKFVSEKGNLQHLFYRISTKIIRNSKDLGRS